MTWPLTPQCGKPDPNGRPCTLAAGHNHPKDHDGSPGPAAVESSRARAIRAWGEPSPQQLCGDPLCIVCSVCFPDLDGFGDEGDTAAEPVDVIDRMLGDGPIVRRERPPSFLRERGTHLRIQPPEPRRWTWRRALAFASCAFVFALAFGLFVARLFSGPW